MSNKISLYKSHKTIYTDPVSGFFNRIRLTTMFFVVVCFFSIPWFNFGERQAFLFDLSYNRFFFFNYTFWPEDFFLFAIFFIMLILLLFIITVYSGRVWCGFFCPQSIWIKMSAFITRRIEGNRNKRKKLDSKLFNFSFLYLKIIKHFIFFVISFLTAFTFISYFVPVKFLLEKILTFDLYYKSFFWLMFFSFFTYFNISWFKEQFCFLICPYARLQSVMFDENTLIVAYDWKRGEKRGSRSRFLKTPGLGDCINCFKCVTCCPTGIDIRDGLQIECISCAACIDACHDVMLKMNYKTGLIKYTRENNLKFYQFNLYKFIFYIFILLLLLFIFIYSLFNRNLMQFSILRNQAVLYQINKEGFIENNYVLKLTNKTQYKNNYLIKFNDTRFNYIGIKNIVLDGYEVFSVDIKLVLINLKHSSRFIPVVFEVYCLNNNLNLKKETQFVLPGYL